MLGVVGRQAAYLEGHSRRLRHRHDDHRPAPVRVAVTPRLALRERLLRRLAIAVGLAGRRDDEARALGPGEAFGLRADERLVPGGKVCVARWSWGRESGWGGCEARLTPHTGSGRCATSCYCRSRLAHTRTWRRSCREAPAPPVAGRCRCSRGSRAWADMGHTAWGTRHGARGMGHTAWGTRRREWQTQRRQPRVLGFERVRRFER